MKNLTINTLLVASIVSVGLSAPISSASAAPYFACNPGYTFQVKNRAARCHKPAGVMTKPLKRCGSVRIPVINKRVGHFYKKNHRGNKDMCVGQFKVGPVTNSNAVEIGCPSGYSKRITPQRDRCVKSRPASNLPPMKTVNR